jgi:PAS domain S-box-containing protein
MGGGTLKRVFDYLPHVLKSTGTPPPRYAGGSLLLAWLVVPLGLTALAVVIHNALFGDSDSAHIYVTFYFAVAASALLCGYRAGLVASAATTASAIWLFDPLVSGAEIAVLALFVVNCLLVIGVCHAISVASLRAATARAEAKQALRLLKSEQLFRLFIEHAPAALALFDKELQCLAASRRWANSYGLGDRPPEGRTVAGPPRFMPVDWSEAQRKALAGQIIRKEEDLIVHPDGREQWLRWEVHPWRDASGAIGGVVIFSEDITSQKRTAIALAENELRLRATLESVEYAVIVTDRRGTIESLNSAAPMLFGYSEAELLGRNIDLIVKEHRIEAKGRLPGAAQDNVVTEGNPEVKGRKKDGVIFPIDYMATDWNDMYGETHRTVTLYDISERRAVEEELARAGRMEAVGRLAGGIAHDFGNLLSIIIGNLELLEPHIRQPRSRLMVRKALEAAGRGAGFTRQLVTLARKRHSEFEDLDLNLHVSGMAVLLEHTLGSNIHLHIDLMPDLWMTRADPVEVDSAIVNLAINAGHAMPNGGTVSIETANVRFDRERRVAGAQERSGEFVQLSVRDTGIGMSKEVRRHAFEPFFTTSENGVGTGLGLPGVYAFVQSCGGFVTLDSAVGQGTTVNIHLPRCAGNDRAAPAKAAKPERKRGHGEVILVVEDNKGVREVSVERLERLGYVTLSAETVAEACHILREDARIALVFSDIVLTGKKTGYDIARWVERNRPEVKVLLTTSYDIGDKTGERDKPNLRIRKLSKPYSASRLADEIRRSLDADPVL